jgi:hypothetical protein
MDHMPGHSEHHAPATDPPARHGMAVIGEQAVYFSHLPMFMFPHAHQLLMEVELKGDGDPQNVYFHDREQHPEQRMYTVNPDPFSLPTLLPVGDSPPEATSFRVALFRGHFERPDTRPARLAAGVTARVRNVIHHHKLQSDAPELAELRYLLFGKASESFLSHFINGVPSFDHLLSVDVDQQLSDEQLSKGIVVKFGGRPDTVAGRIKPGVDTELSADAEIDGGSRRLELRPKIEYYFEAGELAEAM